MMKRFAKEIHRDIEREKDTLIRCRKDMLEQKGYIDSAKKFTRLCINSSVALNGQQTFRASSA